MASVTLAGDTLATATGTLARGKLWPDFLASFGVPKGGKKMKSGDYFFSNFLLWSPFVILLCPKGSKKNWSKCHSSQNVSGQSVTSQSDTGQSVSSQSVSGYSGQRVILAKVSKPRCLWPKCHSGQIVI